MANKSGIAFTAPMERVVMIRKTPMGLRIARVPKGDLDRIDRRVFRAPEPGEVEAITRAADSQVPYPQHLAPMVEASPERLLHEQLKANPGAAKEMQVASENEEIKGALALLHEQLAELKKQKDEQLAELKKQLENVQSRPKCPQCGQDFKNDQGLMVHTTRKHPELRARYGYGE
jgi:hypothetical protein